MELHEQLVDQAVKLEHSPENQGISHQRGHAGQKDSHPEEPLALEVVRLQDIGKKQAENQHDRDLNDEEQEVVAQGLEERQVLEHLHVIAEAHKRFVQPLVGVERQHDGIDEGIEHERRDAEHNGKRQLDPHALFAQCAPGNFIQKNITCHPLYETKPSGMKAFRRERPSPRNAERASAFFTSWCRRSTGGWPSDRRGRRCRQSSP